MDKTAHQTNGPMEEREPKKPGVVAAPEEAEPCLAMVPYKIPMLWEVLGRIHSTRHSFVVLVDVGPSQSEILGSIISFHNMHCMDALKRLAAERREVARTLNKCLYSDLCLSRALIDENGLRDEMKIARKA